MNWKWLAGAGALLFALGFWAGTAGRASGPELDAAHDSTRAAVARADEAEAARAAIDLGARASIQEQTHRGDSALAVARAAQARQPTIVDRIVERVAPADTGVARRVASEVTDSLMTTVVHPLYVALAAADSVNRAQTNLLDAERGARQSAQAALGRAMQENGLLRAARPSWLSRQAPKLALIAGGIGGWYLHSYLAPRL